MTSITHPLQESVDVALRDGSTVHVRPVVPADRDAIDRFLRSLSPESMYLRACGSVDLGWLADWAVDLEDGDRYGLVATSGLNQHVVAHGAYVRLDSERAEVAFEVADALHGQGIATLLLGQLAAVAAQRGITTLVASVLASNWKMLQVFADSGFPVTRSEEDGMIEVSLPTEVSEDVLRAFEQREHTASRSAVASFLKPRSVAVIGASRNPDSVGGSLIHNLVAGGFTGTIYPINPKASEIGGLPCWKSVIDLPEPVDLAVVVVPAAAVVAVARECAEHGVRSLLVISSGFAEVGEEGARRQRDLIRLCRESGMRLIGPNCLGILNTDEAVRLNATFSRQVPPAGHVALMSQSGGVAIALMDVAAELGIGLSSFVSVGNKSDISGNALLEYWEEDPNTSVIALYLESFGNPRRFARLARRVGERKPILAVKAGRTPAGSRAASSHTAALLSTSDVTVDALFRQAGVIRVDTLGELLDTAALIGTQPLPRGGRVAIVTNGGGPGIMCADGCQAAGLEVVELPAAVRRRLARIVPENAAVGNPVDMTAGGRPEDYAKVVRELIAADACDAIVTLFVPALGYTAEQVEQVIDEAAAAAGIPVASVAMGARAGASVTPPESGGAARFQLPEDAVRALAHAVEYSRWLASPKGAPVSHPDYRPDAASEIVAAGVVEGGGWLSPSQTFALLHCYGIPCLRTAVAATVEDAVRIASEIASPIALKASAPGLVHKSDAGGVLLGILGETAVRDAAERIRASVTRAGYELDGLVVQQMAQSGVELIVGVVNDPSFGPVVACGAGGTTAELIGDVAVRITPLTDLTAAEQVRSLRTFPLLDGYRGAPKLDVAGVEDVLLRVSAMVEAHPEIAELDLNPLTVSVDGVCVSDARVRVAPAALVPPLGAL
jgi:acetyl coenzyme A synthetase (ADP forming)-like protein